MKLFIAIIINENESGILVDKSLDHSYKIKFFIDDKNKIYTNDKSVRIKDINYFKVLSALKSEDFDWVVILTHNNFVNITNLINYLEKQDQEQLLYIGGHGDSRKIGDTKFFFHSYTAGLIFNKNSVNELGNEKLFDKYNKICQKNNSDLINLSGLALGYITHMFNFNIIHCNNMWFCDCYGSPCHPGEPNLNKLICCGNMSLPYIDQMLSLLKETKKVNKAKELLSKSKKQKIIIAPGGGLGNLIFQYLYGMTLVKKYDCDLFFYKNYDYWRGCMNKFRIFNNCNFIEETDINVDNYTRLIDDNKYKEISYDPSVNYIIHGYYQSYKYSEEYISEIKEKLFENIKDNYKQIKEFFNTMKKNKKTCLIHVRRGDYLNFSRVHPLCSDAYYEEAIEIMNTNTKFIIFSDDLNYIKNWKLIKKLDHKIIEENDPVNVFLLMTLCDNFIIANSTLSLCAYLFRENKNALLISPHKWFGPDGPKYNMEEIVPEESIIL